MKTKASLGIDIGGTKVALAILVNNRPVATSEFRTPTTVDLFRVTLIQATKKLSAPYKISSIGIASTGIVNRKSCRVLASCYVPYLPQINFKKLLGSLARNRVRLDNDASCFGRAEFLVGQAKRKKNVICLTLGTGIGMCFVINGTLYEGSRNSVGEGGHPFVDLDPEFIQRYTRAKSRKSFGTISKSFAHGLSALVDLLDPEIIVLGGTVAKRQGATIVPAARAAIAHRCINPVKPPTVVISKLRQPVAIGAALLWHPKA